MQSSLEDMGYDIFFEEGRKQLGLVEFPVARVTAEHRKAYTVKNEKGEYRAKITGKHIFKATTKEDYPAVGDWVAIELLDDTEAIIRGILPRHTVLKRKYGDKNKIGEKSRVQVIATNTDVAFIVESVDRDFSPNRFERYFAIALDGGVQPMIILNKVDLLEDAVLKETLSELEKRFPSIVIIPTSSKSEESVEDLRVYIQPRKTYCFLGSSGVGKSTLINALLGDDSIKTSDISSYSSRGTHTTTSRQMYFLDNGGIVIDNPGVREVGITDASLGVDSVFDEITNQDAQCKYSDCTHTHEAGCAVLEAVKKGDLEEAQYNNYFELKKEADHYEMNDFERRKKDRGFGKFRKQYKKDFGER